MWTKFILVPSRVPSAGELCLVGKVIVPSFKKEDLRSFMVPHHDNLPPVPPIVINELNLFAGQLYFRSIDAYEEKHGILGLYLKELPENRERRCNWCSLLYSKDGGEGRRLNLLIARSNSSESSLDCDTKARVSFQRT